MNLRGTLHDDLSVYQEDWGNELHPSATGFSLISNRFAEEINLLRDPPIPQEAIISRTFSSTFLRRLARQYAEATAG